MKIGGRSQASSPVFLAGSDGPGGNDNGRHRNSPFRTFTMVFQNSLHYRRPNGVCVRLGLRAEKRTTPGRAVAEKVEGKSRVIDLPEGRDNFAAEFSEA